MAFSARTPTEPHNLPLFSEVPGSFHPELNWLDGNVPQHPLFENCDDIQRIVRDIKGRLINNILTGIHTILFSNKNVGTNTNVLRLQHSFEENPNLWVAIVSVQKYGVVYLATRGECRHFVDIIRDCPAEADAIDDFLRSGDVAICAINFGVHRFVTEVSEEWKVETPDSLIPPNAISALGPNHFAVRQKDFHLVSEHTVLADDVALYDLHDFSHLTAATLSSKLYGTKYFESLCKLSPAYRCLITSRGLKNLKGPLISDGIIFSQFLTMLFATEAEVAGHTYASLTTTLAARLADYLMARTSLIHLATGRSIKLDYCISPAQLAVLTQNKRYELCASEMEQRVLFRGGPMYDPQDVLEFKTARERIEFLAASKSWTYYEVRNTVKHRVMREAYGIVAKEFVEGGGDMGLSAEDIEIARLVLDAVEYGDYKREELVDLWELLHLKQ